MNADVSKAVFLSYASQDAEAAKRICDALRQAGVEVWFDKSELVGGDAWDAKIRRQIGSCALFVPIISANTQARLEGYFRIEWKLAARRTHAMATAKSFLLPVVIDGTRDAEAHVPDEFRDVQWTKLPSGETPPAFAARVKNLLGGSDEVARVSRPVIPEPTGQETRATRKSSRQWLALVIAGVVIAILALVLARPWEKASPPPTEPSALRSAPITTEIAPAPHPSAARQLAFKARQLFETVDSTRDDYLTAEGLLQRAVVLDSADGLIWAIYSRMNSGFSMRGFDRSASRVEEARTQMERAIRLAPEEAEAWLARGSYLRRADGDRAEAEQALRKAMALAPQDTRPWFDLAWAVSVRGNDEEVYALLEKSIDPARPGSGALARYNQFLLRFNQRRFAEADSLVRAAVAELPSYTFVTGLARNEITWKGDALAAVAAIERMPAESLREPRTVVFAVYARLLARQPAEALATLRRLPVDYIEDSYLPGPKSYWEGRAHEQLGNTEAARAAWESALTVSRREGSGRFNRGVLMQAELLALLGREDEALRLVRTYEQAASTGPLGTARSHSWDYSVAKVYAVLGQTEQALPLLEADLDLKGSAWPLTPALLQLDPLWDKLRKDLRFQKLCEEPAVAPSSLSLTPSHPPKADAKSVAVLAFANLSDDKANEYFSDGISEELLNVLAKVPGLKVTARTSAFYFKGKQVPMAEIAQQLGVAYAVEGSVRKQGDKVRITAQLIKAADGFHVWSDTFTRDLKDIFAVQDEIAALIAQNLKLSMGLTIPATRRAVDPEAHRLVLEGRYFWNFRSQEGFARAEAAFTKAIEIDPQYAQAYAGLADVRWTRAVFDSYAGANRQKSAEIKWATDRALALDPMLAEAYPAAGGVLHWSGRLGEAEQVYQKAIALNPNYALAHHWYSLVLEEQGRLDEALAEIELAIRLDPLSAAALSTRHRYLFMAGRFSESLAAAEKVQALRPGFFFDTGLRAQGYLVAGRRDEALAAARAITAYQSLELRWVSDASAIYVLRALGHEAEAVAHVENLLPRLAADSYLRGLALAALDRWDEAMPYLERTPRGIQSLFFWNPVWDRWRDDPRFLRLMEKIGCMEEYKVARATLARMQQAAKK